MRTFRSMRQNWVPLTEDRVTPAPQDESVASEWPARSPSDGEISQTMSISQVDRLVRATTHPYPGAFVATDEGLVTIWEGTPAALKARSGGCLAIDVADGTFLATRYEVRAD